MEEFSLAENITLFSVLLYPVIKNMLDKCRIEQSLLYFSPLDSILHFYGVFSGEKSEALNLL